MSYIDRIKVQGTEYDVLDRRVRLADGQDFDYGTLVQGGINNSNGYTTGAHLRRSETYWPVIEGPVNVVMQNGLTGYIRLYDSSRTMIDPGEGMPGSDTTNHVLVIAKNTTMTLTMKEYNPNTAYFRFYFSCGTEDNIGALVRENARIIPLQTVATSGEMQTLGDDVSDLKSAFGGLTLLQFTPGGCFSAENGEIIDISSPTVNDSWSYCVAECTEGEAFFVQSAGSSAMSAIYWLDQNSRVIWGNAKSQTSISTPVFAPPGAKKLIINRRMTELRPSYRGRIVGSTWTQILAARTPADWQIGYVSATTGNIYAGLPSGNSWYVLSTPIKFLSDVLVECDMPCRFPEYDSATGAYVKTPATASAPVRRKLSQGVTYRIQVLASKNGEASSRETAEEMLDHIWEHIRIHEYESSWIKFLPLTNVYIGDVQQRIYFNELARFNPHDGYFNVSVSGATHPEITYTDRYIQFDPTAKKDITLTIDYYVKDVLEATKTLTAHLNPTAIPAKKMLFIGDSYTANGGMIKWFADHNSNVILYGTRSTEIDGSTYHHEGRGGWTAGNYCTQASSSSVTNPFYNPTTQTFDFSYYIANEGSAFADVDIVNILLGRNNNFSIDSMTYLDTMVASIKAYNSNIMVVLMGANDLAANNSGAGKYLQNVHTSNRQAHAYNDAFYDHYKDSPDVVMCFPGLNLDNVYDFERREVDASIINTTPMTVYVDNAHPWKIPGLGKFGIALNGLLRNILNE